MTDRGAYWRPVPDWSTAIIEADGLAVTARCDVQPIWLVSGDIPLFLSRALALPLAGLAATAASERYAVRLAPDRLLVLAGADDVPRFGWHDNGYATTDVSAGYVLIDVTGAAADRVMAQGTGIDLTRPPGGDDAPAVIQFAGLTVALARRPDGWRFHIERPLATALWTWLQLAGTP